MRAGKGCHAIRFGHSRRRFVSIPNQIIATAQDPLDADAEQVRAGITPHVSDRLLDGTDGRDLYLHGFVMDNLFSSSHPVPDDGQCRDGRIDRPCGRDGRTARRLGCGN